MWPENDLLEDSDADFVTHSGSHNVMNMLMGRILRTDIVEVPVFTSEFKFSVPYAMPPSPWRSISAWDTQRVPE